jgi:rubrerythrin
MGEINMLKETTNGDWNKSLCANLIAENLEKESEAIKEYLPLLKSLEDGGYKKAVSMIREIISDEKNHLLLLMGLIQEFDGDIPVSSDGIQKALSAIKNNIAKEESNE